MAAPPAYTRAACRQDDHASSLTLAGGKILINCEARLSSVIRDLDGKDLFERDTEFLMWDVHTDSSGSSTLAVRLSDGNPPLEVFAVKDVLRRHQIIRSWQFFDRSLV